MRRVKASALAMIVPVELFVVALLTSRPSPIPLLLVARSLLVVRV
jgi:hypothetical protein